MIFILYIVGSLVWFDYLFGILYMAIGKSLCDVNFIYGYWKVDLISSILCKFFYQIVLMVWSTYDGGACAL